MICRACARCRPLPWNWSFPIEWQDPDCHLWFFEHGLPGYSWYVPKARGWLNVGVGGMAGRLKQRGEDIRQHWQHFADKLLRQFRHQHARGTRRATAITCAGRPGWVASAMLF